MDRFYHLNETMHETNSSQANQYKQELSFYLNAAEQNVIHRPAVSRTWPALISSTTSTQV